MADTANLLKYNYNEIATTLKQQCSQAVLSTMYARVHHAYMQGRTETKRSAPRSTNYLPRRITLWLEKYLSFQKDSKDKSLSKIQVRFQ